jgi:hypothetical protein
VDQPSRLAGVQRPLEPGADGVERGSGREDLGHPQALQLGHILGGHDPTPEDQDVVEVSGGQLVENTREEGEVGPGEDREADGIGVFLADGLGHLLRGLEQARVDHLEAGIAKGSGDDLDPTVVAVEARLGHDDSVSALHGRDTTGVSPVKPSNNRSILLAIGGVLVAVLGLGALLLFVFALQSGTESGTVEVRLGDDTFAAGSAEALADAIDRDGPILFSDVASGERDIFLQHTGDDARSQWRAFDAREIDASRDCTLEWSAEAQVFEDPCDGSTVPPDGTGLRQYDVEVTESGRVVIDLRSSSS